MKLTDLLTPELYRRWHSLDRECPGLVKQRAQRLQPLYEEFERCIRYCGRPSQIKCSQEEEAILTFNVLLIVDAIIELATEPRHGTN